MRRGRPVIGTALATGVVLAAAACGSGGGGTGGSPGGTTSSGSSSKPVISGTTDKVTSFDPAGSYDLGSWTVVYNVYQNVLSIPPGGNSPKPEAAQDCSFTNPTTYTCTMKDGLTFSNGDPLTAKDVKFSIDRVLAINDPNGPSSLFSSMDKVEAPDDKTVTFTLKAADQTWPFVLTTGGAAIVDSKVFPADKLQPDDKVIGSGHYTLAQYQAGQQAVLKPNAKYTGDSKTQNAGVIIRYLQEASALKLAVEQGDVDIAYRSLSPTDVESLKGESSRGVKVVEGAGTEIRYLVFNVSLPPSQQQAVRQAVAATIDRDSIAKNVYKGTVTPLYSMIPQGLKYATKAYADVYGQQPNPAMAKKFLTDAGITTPVPITVWWTPSHYGPSSGDEYTEIKRQLEGSGLFTVNLQQTEWQTYSKAYSADQYPAFELGWFPDFPDADNYASPFYQKGGFYKNHYNNPEIDAALQTERTSSDDSVRSAAFEKIQKIAAQDVPTVPVWQGKQVAAVRDGVTGVEKTFDPSFTFRYWLVSK